MSNWTLHHGDALDVLREMPDVSIDAVITDPPYCSGSVSEASRTQASGQGLRSENLRRFGWFIGDNMTTAGLAWLLRAVANEARRLLKPTGHLVVFMDWRMIPHLVPAIESAGVRYQNLLVWDKGSAGLGTGFRCQHEMIAHFTNGSPEYHSKAYGNVLRSKRVRSAEREHQTQKPTDLLRQLVEVVTPIGGTVLDPFAGSGSTLLAALDGYRPIGVERDGRYVEIARKRIEGDAPLFNRQPEDAA